MWSQDILLFLVLCLQPLVLSWVILLLARRTLQSSQLFSKLFGVRGRVRMLRYFECAAPSRVPRSYRYNLNVLAILAIFIIYDVDLLFFLSEAVYVDSWVIQDGLLFLGYLAIFLIGLTTDKRQGGFVWSL